jgi:hypothetical protein
MTPCVVLEVLAVAVFLLYCLATRQLWRAGIAVLVLLVGGLAGVAALDALLLHAQATLPSATSAGGEVLVEGPVEAWEAQWAGALMLIVGAWSGALAYLQWRR